MIRDINSVISYIPATNNPLSSDIGIVRGRKGIYIYDVGANEESRRYINELSEAKSVILSHFHPDHTRNMPDITYDRLYVGKETFKYTNAGIIVTEPVIIEDDVLIEIIPVSATHSKGSLILNVNREYVFLGDCLYTAMHAGKRCYNAQLLKAQIDTLKELECRYFLLSHDERFVCSKEAVIRWLESIYAKRDKNSSYINV